MAAARFLIAGSILFCAARLLGVKSLKPKLWGPSALTGALLLLIGNGGLVLAERRVPSGVAALAIMTEPLWIGVLDWLRPGGKRPTCNVGIGLIVGLLGALVLIGPSNALGAGRLDSRRVRPPWLPGTDREAVAPTDSFTSQGSSHIIPQRGAYAGSGGRRHESHE
jgi:drug/metabolite transporter (DMT)-like permease